ncbi:MAG: polyribonucleotide nucleotidyltransferase, partial [Patescibacteria group bacterium]
MNKYVKKEFAFAGKKLVLETGELAMQANMAIKATYGDTVVLVTAVSGAPNPDIDFFPLTVVYEEKLYASGSIKSSRFVKRDGRPTDDAVITKRLVDHAIRPLFPSDYMDEVQVAITVLSLDETSDPEFLSLVATSACLMASSIPWNGPMVSARVAFSNEDYVLNPPRSELEGMAMDMMVSFVGADRKFLAVEADAQILPEEKILGGFEFARNNLEEMVTFMNDFVEEVNPNSAKYTYVSKALDSAMLNDVSKVVKSKIDEMLSAGFDKTKLKEYQETAMEELFAALEGKYKKADMVRAFAEVEKKSLQKLILDEGKRPDGRKIDEIRKIDTKVGLLPRTHGSALFTRGVTQVLTVATLGSPSLEILIQDMYGEKSKRYIHYYNFPPFSVGETGKFGAPSSRDIGHGMLAEKALKPVIPDQKEFPYTILLTSETLSSSGSSSMAATCGSTLALMDAGVPIKDMVAGIGVGLIVNDDMSKQLIMTDLAYMEDAFGFMDFKMTGTKDGVTAIQCDMKLPGIPMSLLPKIIEQSKEGRLYVLEEMRKTISSPRQAVSQYAPKTLSTKIDPEKIGMVIGSGGKTIKEIQEKYGVEISIEDDGSVVVSAVSSENAEKAMAIVEGIVKDVKVGEIYEGVVEDIADFGAFVQILPGKTGLVHISELSHEYVASVNDVVKIGDNLQVKVIDKGPMGKISLSVKALTERPAGMPEEQPRNFDRRPPRPSGPGRSRDGGRFSNRDSGRRPNRDR